MLGEDMERAIVFLDGGYLDYIAQDAKKKFDFLKLAMKVCDKSKFIRAYYYHCLPYQSNPPTQEEKERFKKGNVFFDKLKKLNRFQVRLGKLVKRGEYSDGTPILNQKRVDVYLATDLVKFSAQKAMDEAIILTSDSDYVPAIQAAKEFGVVVKLDFYDNLPINQELLDACDEFLKFKNDFLDDVLR